MTTGKIDTHELNDTTNVVVETKQISKTESKGKHKIHKKAVIPETESLSERRERAKANAKVDKDIEPTLKIDLKTSIEESTVPEESLKPVEINETIIADTTVKEESKSRKEAVKEMNSDTSVILDAHETYFEKIYRKQEEEEKLHPKSDGFKENMIPTVTTIDDNIIEKLTPTKKQSKYTPSVAISEVLKSTEDLESGMCQYIVNALYIIDSSTNTKYLQGCILTLPDDITKLSKVFLLAAKSGRLVKCQDFQRKIVRESQVYDTRTKKWIKEGTTEYEEYQKRLQKEKDKIVAKNENAINQERKRLRID